MQTRAIAQLGLFEVQCIHVGTTAGVDEVRNKLIRKEVERIAAESVGEVGVRTTTARDHNGYKGSIKSLIAGQRSSITSRHFRLQRLKESLSDFSEQFQRCNQWPFAGFAVDHHLCHIPQFGSNTIRQTRKRSFIQFEVDNLAKMSRKLAFQRLVMRLCLGYVDGNLLEVLLHLTAQVRNHPLGVGCNSCNAAVEVILHLLHVFIQSTDLCLGQLELLRDVLLVGCKISFHKIYLHCIFLRHRQRLIGYLCHFLDLILKRSQFLGHLVFQLLLCSNNFCKLILNCITLSLEFDVCLVDLAFECQQLVAQFLLDVLAHRFKVCSLFLHVQHQVGVDRTLFGLVIPDGRKQGIVLCRHVAPDAGDCRAHVVLDGRNLLHVIVDSATQFVSHIGDIRLNALNTCGQSAPDCFNFLRDERLHLCIRANHVGVENLGHVFKTCNTLLKCQEFALGGVILGNISLEFGLRLRHSLNPGCHFLSFDGSVSEFGFNSLRRVDDCFLSHPSFLHQLVLQVLHRDECLPVEFLHGSPQVADLLRTCG